MTKAKTTKKGKGGRVVETKKQDIFAELSSLIESGQILGITQTQLAEKFKVRRQTIAEYLKTIYESIPPEDINTTRVKIQVMFDRLFREVQTMIIKAKDFREKKEAIDLLLRMTDRFTVFLESFHVKAKAKEIVEVGFEKQLVIVTDSPLIEVEAEEVDDGKSSD